MILLSIYALILRIIAFIITIAVIVQGIVFPIIGIFYCKISDHDTGCIAPFGWMSSAWNDVYNDLFLVSLYLLGLPLLIWGTVVIVLLIILLRIVFSKNLSSFGTIWRTIFVSCLGLVMLSTTLHFYKGSGMSQSYLGSSGFTAASMAPEAQEMISKGIEFQKNYSDALENTYKALRNRDFTEEEINSMIDAVSNDIQDSFYKSDIWCKREYKKNHNTWIDNNHISVLMKNLGITTGTPGDLRFLYDNPQLKPVAKKHENSKKYILEEIEKMCASSKE